MVTNSLKNPISLTIAQPLFQRLEAHLFPGDHDEHGAVIAAGLVTTARGTRLLAREVFIARDGVDYVPGTRGYRALTARFVAKVSGYCANHRLCYLPVHCHGGENFVTFSGDDLASHEHGYPALLDITNGSPVGALVFARNAVAGDIWTREGRFPLAHMTIVGSHIKRWYPGDNNGSIIIDPLYDRHARLFGDVGQAILRNLKIGIIGLGGGGSLMNEWLARLGVGHIVAIDFDRIDVTNLPRVVGATRSDSRFWLTGSGFHYLQILGERIARHKVSIAKRVARQANPHIKYDAIVGDVLDVATANRLKDVDFVVLATDTIQSRLVFNALVNQYLIPGVQIGAKVSTSETGEVGTAFAATRLVLPYGGGGCLKCHDLIPANRLNDEALSENERRAQRYVDDNSVVQPSVITLNALSAAPAANDIMLMFTGLLTEDIQHPHTMNFVRERQLSRINPQSRSDCLDCGIHSKSRYARGDGHRLPCRMN